MSSVDLSEQAHKEVLNTNATIKINLANEVTHIYNCMMNEVPGVGVVDFTFNDPLAALVDNYIVNSSRIYIDGVRQILSSYTENPATWHIVFIAAPAGGTVITADFDQTSVIDWSGLD